MDRNELEPKSLCWTKILKKLRTSYPSSQISKPKSCREEFDSFISNVL